MPLKLVPNKCHACKLQGCRYARDIREDDKEFENMLSLIILIREKYDKLLTREILMTRREESLREEEKQKKYEKTYQDFIESLRRVKALRELKEKELKELQKN